MGPWPIHLSGSDLAGPARTCMRRSGCFPGVWNPRHLQVACLNLKSWTIYQHLSFRSIRPCEQQVRTYMHAVSGFFSWSMERQFRSSGAPKIVVFWCSDWPKIVTRYFASLSLHAILKFVPHTAARRCSMQQEKTPRAKQYTSLLMPCAHGKLNVKHHRTIAKPETHITRRERSCAGEKIENRAQKNVYKRHSHHHPPHDSKQHNY